MPTARRPTKERQAELADAALEIIATRGIVALTTQSLADTVGISTGAIFRHFKSLDALLVAVADRVGELLDATYPPLTLTPIEQLARFVEARSAVVGAHAGVLRLMVSEQFALALPDASARRLHGAIDTTRKFLTETITHAQAARQLRDDLEPSAVAVIVMGTMQMIGLTGLSRTRHTQQADAARAALMRLLAPTTSTTPTEPKPRRR